MSFPGTEGIESPLEYEFWYYVHKTIIGDADSKRQVEIPPYRVDSVFKCDRKLVVVELDGSEFHQDKVYDYRRDIALLKVVDAVVHIPYAAMHFYPHATFCVLREWFPRFALCGVDMFCIHISELKGEMDAGITSNGDFQTRDQWLKWAEPNFELWGEYGGVGWVGSPTAWLRQWNVKPITKSDHAYSNNAITDAEARRQVYRAMSESYVSP